MATPGHAGRELESAIDALYQGPLEAFTAERNALATALRKGGDRAAAERVKGLARPSVTAWAVNQVWWTRRAAFEAMLEAGARLKDAHLTWSSGSQTDVRAAAENRRQTVRAVVDAALAALGDPKTVAPDMQYRISGTVEALASGAGADATLGRLSRDLQSSGLEGLGALAGAAAAAPPRAVKPARHGRPTLVHSSKVTEVRADEPSPARRGESAKEAAARRRAQELAKVEARLKELEHRLEALTRDATAQSAEEARAREAADEARDQVTERERQLEDAREAEKAARRAVATASKAASETELMRARTARDVAAARAQRDSLQPA
jgi:hypothetical protein